MATASGPGRSHRSGLTIIELFEMFPDEDSAEAWFEEQRWPEGERFCPECGSTSYAIVKSRTPMPYRCRDCRKHFSVRKGTVMQGSPLGLRLWVIAIYMMTTGIKGTSSMKLHRELGITQKTAWFMMQRIARLSWRATTLRCLARSRSMNPTSAASARTCPPASARSSLAAGRSERPPSSEPRIRATKQVRAKVIDNTEASTLLAFVAKHADPSATVYTDEAPAYKKLPNRHEAVKHSIGEYVRKQAHTNGIESFWALLKRGFTGTYHRMSPKHLHRYVNEFAGRHNVRDSDTLDQMALLSQGMVGKRLTYERLIS